MKGESLRHTVSITNPAGFHMRPMQAFVEAARRFPCTVAVSRSNMPAVDGKSMLGLLGLIAEQGTDLVIEVSGPGAAEAMQALLHVFQHSYDEA